MEQIDIYPTLASLANFDVPSHCQGNSLVPLLDSSQANVNEHAYCLLRKNAHLLRTNRWAFIRYEDGSKELYDMKDDPKQFENLAGEVELKQTVVQLDERLNGHLASFEHFKPKVESEQSKSVNDK